MVTYLLKLIYKESAGIFSTVTDKHVE